MPSAEGDEGLVAAFRATTGLLDQCESWTVEDAADEIAERLRVLLEDPARVERAPPRRLRRDVVHLLSRLPAAHRLGLVFHLAEARPELVDAIFEGPGDPRLEPAYWNLWTSIGLFARHRLLADIFSSERVDRLGRTLGDEEEDDFE